MQTIALAKLHLMCDKCHAYTKGVTLRVLMHNPSNCSYWWAEADQSNSESNLSMQTAMDYFIKDIKARIAEGYELVQE